MSRACRNTTKIILAVAGFDPSSGAGVTLDLRVIQNHGHHGMGLITALTSQNTQKINQIHCPSSRFLSEQYRILREDVTFSGIKIGMIGCRENIGVVGEILSDNLDLPLVIDPVFKSSSEKWLIEKEAISDYICGIKGKASLLTPNLAEAGWISGMEVGNLSQMQKSAEKIFALTSIPCLIKGGHLPDSNIDILFDGRDTFRFENEKLPQSVHGTGCFLSASILCYLVDGISLDQAVSLGIKDTHHAINGAFKLGKGQLIFGDIP
jgi:hydroxymethylpyrimidine/phosphomethylpyrimidine kinase